MLRSPSFLSQHSSSSSSSTLLVLLLMATSATLSVVSAQSSLLSPRDLERRLKGLTDDELEQICIERGFELITDELDEETGLPVVSMHQDYIDAAIQCIQMEDIVINDLYNKGEQGKNSLPTMNPSDRMNEMVLEENNNSNHHRTTNNLQLLLVDNVLIPLPKPVKRFLAKLLIRLARDGTDLLLFVRRQFDAIVGAVRDRITDARNVGEQQQQDWRRQQQRAEQDL